MPDGRLHGRRILIVEDEFLQAMELDTALREAGAEILGPAASVTDALCILANGVLPDAASLDVNLDGQSVYPLADALASHGVPFVFTTGYDKPTIPASYVRNRCLKKPVDPETVIETLGKLLAD